MIKPPEATRHNNSTKLLVLLPLRDNSKSTFPHFLLSKKNSFHGVEFKCELNISNGQKVELLVGYQSCLPWCGFCLSSNVFGIFFNNISGCFVHKSNGSSGSPPKHIIGNISFWLCAQNFSQIFQVSRCVDNNSLSRFNLWS